MEKALHLVVNGMFSTVLVSHLSVAIPKYVFNELGKLVLIFLCICRGGCGSKILRRIRSRADRKQCKRDNMFLEIRHSFIALVWGLSLLVARVGEGLIHNSDRFNWSKPFSMTTKVKNLNWGRPACYFLSSFSSTSSTYCSLSYHFYATSHLRIRGAVARVSTNKIGN